MVDMYLRKSAIEEYEFCPYKFKLTYIDGIENVANYKMLIGTRFHDFAYWFFDVCQAIDIDNWLQLVPTSYTDEERGMCAWFIEQELIRWHELGGNVELFMPVHREIKLIDDDRKLTGTCDRIDWWCKDKGEMIIVEYKTSKSFKKSSITRQLAFYKLLVDSGIKTGNITKMKYINPRTHDIQIIDCKSTYTDKVMVKILDLRDAIEHNIYPRKCNYIKNSICGMCSPDECGAYG